MHTKHWLVFAVLLLGGCSGSSPRVLSGRIAPGFPNTITTVKVIQGSTVVASGPVASDGTFRVAVPLSSGLSVRFVGTGHTTLVMPRRSGGIQRTFMLAEGGDVDLGAIHYVGNSASTHFSFHTSPSTECDHDCHDQSGATCVDDDDGNDECSGDEDHDGDHDGDHHDDHHGDDSDDHDGSGSGADSGSGASSGTGASTGSASGEGDHDGHDDGDCVPEHDIHEGCGDGGGGGSGGSGSSGSGTIG